MIEARLDPADRTVMPHLDRPHPDRPHPDRRGLLKSATEELHRSLDELASTLDLASHADYSLFLLANAGPLTAMETALEDAGVARLLQDWPQRTRRAAIASDLETLGLDFERLPTRALESHSEQLGVLYVLEGSRLGAQMLARQVAQAADARVIAARAFLDASDGTHWRSFLRLLETFEPVDVTAMTAAALRAFGVYRAAFAKLMCDRFANPLRPSEENPRVRRHPVGRS